MQILSPADIKKVTAKSNSKAALILIYDWLLITSAFVLVAKFPSVLSVLVALFVIGARQLALGIIVHETGHQSFFQQKSANELVGSWLSGYWIFSSQRNYMKGHIKHHRLAGTVDDPDLKNYQAYPVSKKSFRRKIFRDLSGQTGWRRLKSIGRSVRNYRSLDKESQKTVRGGLIVNLGLFSLFIYLQVPWLILIWVGAFATTHMLSTRLRQVAEHAAVPDLYNKDARLNTRTLITHWWERLLLAPHQISFHMEHHLMPSVPMYHLPLMHRLLAEQGYFENITFIRGFVNLFKKVTQ
jgi:fatty acid desaturase